MSDKPHAQRMHDAAELLRAGHETHDRTLLDLAESLATAANSAAAYKWPDSPADNRKDDAP